MLELKNISKTYKSKKGSDTIALKNITTILPNKGMIFLVGKSGSGKSTLLNLLGGLDSADDGEIIFNGKDINKFNVKEFDSYRNTYVGFVFQEFNVLEQYNVYENIELALKLQKINPIEGVVDSLLNSLGISNLGKRKINELSGGQKQRVAIARALIKNPKLILADEPTGNLDSSSSEQIFSILKEVSKEKLVVVVSHDIQSARKYADRIIELEDGNIISDTNGNIIDDNDNFVLKESNLPFSYSLKLALINLKIKPLKLFLTIIITTFSLVFMAIALNFTFFNPTDLKIRVMNDNNKNIVDISKWDVGLEGRGSMKMKILNKDDVENISNNIESKYNLVYSLFDNGKTLSLELPEKDEKDDFYSSIPYFFEYVEVNDERILEKVIGNKPQKYDEIVIHKYLADYIIEYGVFDSDEILYKPTSYEDFINSGKYLKLGNNKVKVVGILDVDDSLYKEAKKSKKFNYDILRQFFYTNYSENSRFIYVKDFVAEVNLPIHKESNLSKILLSSLFRASHNIKPLNSEVEILTNNGIKKISSLNKNEIVASTSYLMKLYPDYNEKFQEYINKNKGELYIKLLIDFTLNYLSTNNILDKTNLTITTFNFDKDEYIPVKIIGITVDENDYISQTILDEYVPDIKLLTGIKVYEDNNKKLRKILDEYELLNYADEYEYGTMIKLSIPYSDDITGVISIYKTLHKYILAVCLVFVLFTFLIFYNFIAVSISYIKKEIGILRAIGAKSFDLIKIFACESIIVGIISWVLSVIGFIYVINLLNNSLFKEMYYEFNGIILDPLIIVFSLLFAVIMSLLITILSLNRVNKVKPIEAILNK